MKNFNATELRAHLPWADLIAAQQAVFCAEVVEPVRHHHGVTVPGEAEATLLLMPAWIEGKYLGVKQVLVVPGNNARGLPAISGIYTLSDAGTGAALAQMDAPELTARRTAAASALASSYLSRENSEQLLMIGAGRLAHALVEAHCAVRPIKRVRVWSRTQASAEKLLTSCTQQGLQAEICLSKHLKHAVRAADIVSCASLATEPLIKAKWLSPGTHLDLVGAFRPDMREVDGEAVRCAAVFVDTRAGALAEAGDLVQARAEGFFSDADVVASLRELCCNHHAGRAALATSIEPPITLFKSVGAAREDLAAAILAYESSA